MSGNSGSGNIVNETPRISALRIQTSCYGVAVPVVIGRQRCTGNMLYYGDLQAIRHEEKQSTGGGGGKGGGGGTTISNVSYTYRYSMQVGVCEGPVSVGEVWMVSGSDKLRLSQNPQYGYVINAGGTPNAYSSVLRSRHPGQFFYYPGLANFTAVDLGEFSGDSPPSFSFEVFGVGYDAAIDGADPAVAVRQIITDTRWGASAPAKWFPPVTGYGDYAVAMGWVLGLEMAQQKPAADWIQEILDQTNAAAVWAADRLTIVPFGDTEVSGNGRIWVPNVTPIYDLTDDDFIGSADAPILVTRKADSETYNIQPVEFRNQANEYNIESVEGDDPASVAMFGAKKNSSTLTAHGIRDASAAARLGKVRVQRIIRTRNGYEFTLPWTYCCLLPMDIVMLTDSWLGLDHHPVRLTNVVEQATLEIKCEAEDFPAGAGHAALVQRQGADGYNKDFNFPPSAIATPAFIESNRIKPTKLGISIGVAVAPLNENWGGCDIYVSLDGSTYQFMARSFKSARYGTTKTGISNLPSEQVGVSLFGIGGQLNSAADISASTLQTLSVISEEYVSYSTATLDSENSYTLTLGSRGALHTDALQHSSGCKFVRVDDAIVWSDPIDANLIGKTVYFKICSFNQFGGAIEPIESANVYSHVVSGGYARRSPPNVSGFVASVLSGLINLSWSAADDDDVKNYGYGRIKFSEKQSGATWADGIEIGRRVPGSSSAVSLPALSGSYLMKWVDSSGIESDAPAIVTTTAPTVIAMNAVAEINEAFGLWSGNKTDMSYIPTYGGILLDSKKTVSQMDLNISEWPNLSAIGGVVDAGQYRCASPVDIGSVQVCRVTTAVSAGAFCVTDMISVRGNVSEWNSVSGLDVHEYSVVPQIRVSNDGISWGEWFDFVTGDISARFFDFRINVENQYDYNNVLINSLKMQVDMPDKIQSGNDLQSAYAAKTILFVEPFYKIPAVAVTAQDMATGDYFTIQNKTVSGFDILFKNLSSQIVIRTFDYTAKGY